MTVSEPGTAMDTLSIAVLAGTAALFGAALLLSWMLVLWRHDRGLDDRDDPPDSTLGIPPV